MDQRFRIADIIESTRATLIGGDPGFRFESISTDSRTISKGQLFWALTGDNFDGNLFVRDALRKGACGAVLSDIGIAKELVDSDVCRETHSSSGLNILLVEDTLSALGSFALWWRQNIGLKVVAITGSCGKTTTKELLASILQTTWKTGKNPGNFNNLIGLPLSILDLSPGVEWAVFELGINQAGEMDKLASIAAPDCAVITEIAPAHLEGLNSIEVIAHEKGRLFHHLKQDGLAVVNLDNQWILNEAGDLEAGLSGYTMYDTDLPEGMHRFNHVVRCVGFSPDDTGSFVHMDLDGKKYSFHLPLIGRVNVQDALAATCVAHSIGVTPDRIVESLTNAAAHPGRLAVCRISDDIIVIDDSYNANPASMKAALNTLSLWARGFKIAILGDMLELGKDEVALHREIGEVVASVGVDFLVTVGRRALHILEGAVDAGLSPLKVKSFESTEEFLSGIGELEVLSGKRLQGPGAILVKASRRMRFDKIVDCLTNCTDGCL